MTTVTSFALAHEVPTEELLTRPKVFDIDAGRPVDSIIEPSKHFTMIFNIVIFVVQIIIVQYGSFVFSCVALTFEQWMWCLFFGVSVLLWHQVINLIPVKRHIPKLGVDDVDELALSVDLGPEEPSRLGASLT
ncbi:unnamed protein product [Rotaria sordida]|uniref:Cation-transporting P-type ATPase C-terminal domain-containing protein n=1 Tax=Rotaria sordida TaxID=392033 RepID=A0A814PR51_9BILA|nr:unnamed protein product [Rotaria sordida]CAF1167447.1 unnamed protein product [Rotaria sordida]CAF3620884.1 unnamed protein product [Rotaria sordida]CAF3756228.1 unnamed protein product [Rotaria sordida]